MSPLTVVFWRTQRVLLVAWASAAVIAANAPYATGATWAGREHVYTTDVRSVLTALMARRTVVPNKEELLPGAASARHNILTGGGGSSVSGAFCR